MRLNHKVDANHAVIRDGLRQRGFSVFDASGVGGGFPDLVVGGYGVTVLMEVKESAKSHLNEAQLEFHQKWRGGFCVTVTSLGQAVATMDMARKRRTPLQVPKMEADVPQETRPYGR